jgi:CRISPR-associated protein Csx10
LIKSFNGTAHLGRSRSAQFGRVHIQASTALYLQPQKIESKQITLWLLSDLSLYHEGQYLLTPTPESIGLPKDSKLLKNQSFIRSRRYSTYNAYRKHYDKERQVIARGSVLRYELPADFTDYKVLEQQLTQGLGLYSENGLGQVWINPPLLIDTHPQWIHTAETKTLNKKLVDAPKSILIETLQRRSAKVQFGTEPRRIAERIFNELCEKVKFARQYHAMPKGVAFDLGKTPSRTQFGRFKELANQYRNDPNTLWDELTNPTNGMLKIRSEQEETNRQSDASYQRGGWQLKFGLKSEHTLGDYLKLALEEHKNKSYFPQIIGELAALGLTDQWEKYSLGLEQQGAEA